MMNDLVMIQNNKVSKRVFRRKEYRLLLRQGQRRFINSTTTTNDVFLIFKQIQLLEQYGFLLVDTRKASYFILETACLDRTDPEFISCFQFVDGKIIRCYPTEPRMLLINRITRAVTRSNLVLLL